jgi:precorrin-8X/cobalt-precorrin-8 methylmutase
MQMSLNTQTPADGKKAVLLLGHGSKLAEANDTLRKIASTLEASGGYGIVLPAFLQLENPDFQEAVDHMVKKGFNDITVMPYFLYPGAHVTKDIPAEMDNARARFPDLSMTITRNIGFHDKLIDIVIERIDENNGSRRPAPPVLDIHPIEKESMRIIGSELDASGIPEKVLPIVKRVIHSTADFKFKDILKFSPGAIEAGITAIREGRGIVTDVNMVKAGISGARLSPFGVKVHCNSSDPDVAEAARMENSTRTSVAMRKAAPLCEGGIVAVGNAPTALTEILSLVKQGKARPALIVGVPVGFVGAAEAKEELTKSGIEFITSVGRKGGSTVAVAIINALTIEAASEGTFL